jgi:hypothetical protein
MGWRQRVSLSVTTKYIITNIAWAFVILAAQTFAPHLHVVDYLILFVKQRRPSAHGYYISVFAFSAAYTDAKSTAPRALEELMNQKLLVMSLSAALVAKPYAPLSESLSRFWIFVVGLPALVPFSILPFTLPFL